MKTLKGITLGFVLIAILGASCKKNIFCKEKAKKGGGPCLSIYEPVCGCNGITYGNECEANSYGIKKYTQGACD